MGEIPEEAIEAACEAYEDHEDAGWVKWADYDNGAKDECRRIMRHALVAALPHLSAALAEERDDYANMYAELKWHYASVVRQRDALRECVKWAEHDLGVANLALDHATLNERGPGPMLSDGFINSLRAVRALAGERDENG